MKFCRWTKNSKNLQVTLGFINCHNKFPTFSRKNMLCTVLGFAWHRVPTFISKYPDRVNFYIHTSICYFIKFCIISVMVFLMSYLTSLQTIYFVVSNPANNFFCSIYHRPLPPKKNDPSLIRPQSDFLDDYWRL